MNLSAVLVALFTVSMLVVYSINNQVRKVTVSNALNYLIAAIMIFSAAFRSELVGSDTPDYMEDYMAMSGVSLISVISDYPLSVVYYSTSWFAKFLGFPTWLWFGIVEAFYVFSFLYFINSYSRDRLFSFFCFLTIGLFFPSYCIMKQIVAMSFALLSYVAVSKKGFKKAVVFFVLGFFSHQSIILFLIAYLLYFFRNRKKTVVILTVALLLVSFLGANIWSSIVGGYGNEHYMMYAESDEDYSSTAFIYMATLTFIVFLLKRKYYNNNPVECTLYLSISLFACVLQSLASSFSIAHRLAYYFMPFMILLIPNTISSMNNKVSRMLFQILYVAMMSFFLIYTQRNIPYLVDIRYFSFFQ